MSLPRTPSFRLDGRRALVAGASSGIGLACAAALAEAGAAVTLAARRADRLEANVAAFRAKGWQAEAATMGVVDVKATLALEAEPLVPLGDALLRVVIEGLVAPRRHGSTHGALLPSMRWVRSGGIGRGVSIAEACGWTSSGQVGSQSQSAEPHSPQNLRSPELRVSSPVSGSRILAR
jgi:hypothetical protein